MRCIIFSAPSAMHAQLSSHCEHDLKLERFVLLQQEKGMGLRTIRRQGYQV